MVHATITSLLQSCYESTHVLRESVCIMKINILSVSSAADAIGPVELLRVMLLYCTKL